MGQRHQFFVKIKNPIHARRYGKLRYSLKERKKGKELFGDGKTTILAYHNQWLYGRSAAVNLLNVLALTNPDTMSKYGSLFSDDFSEWSINENERLDNWVKLVNIIFSFQTNPLHPRGIGMDRIYFLNEDEPGMREYFDRGDNNDGVTIIDTITRKYCMMNIFDVKVDKDSGDVYALPFLTPVSARDYMRAYYPESEDTITSYHADGKSRDELVKLAKEHKSDNYKIDKEIQKLSNGVLTVDELKKIFPKYWVTRPA